MNVSRETTETFDALVSIVLKWNKAINLISSSTAEEIKHRHVSDSAQLYALGVPFKKWVDLGSGGGFPALVIAILAKHHSPDAKIVMVESDQRKCEFLRHASRELELNTEVINSRIENIAPLNGDVVSARALSSLNNLLGFYKKHRSVDGVGLFPKGMKHEDEIAEAKLTWKMQYTLEQSRTEDSAVIVRVENVVRA